jgi:putative addiction module component (TIGR02574 family)
VPVNDAEKLLLDARLADVDAHPDDQSPWSEVKERLRRLIP